MFAYSAGRAFDKAKPTLVFVHGAGLDHSSFLLQSRYFAYHGWNVLAVDLPGHGRTPGSPISSVRGMAEWVLKAVPAEKFAIVVPETNPAAVSSGRRSSETIQRSQISSRRESMGDIT